MARMVPELNPVDLGLLMSQAEAKLYRGFRDQLDDQTLILHSQCFIRQDSYQGHVDAEADFIIFDPQGGFLVVEVKGGGITFDPVHNTWCSIDRHGKTHRIKNPFEQAKSEKYAVLEQLKVDSEWHRLKLRIPMGHAVFFPDVDDLSSLTKPDVPVEILGGKQDLASLSNWVKQVMVYWSGDSKEGSALGSKGMAIIERKFCRQIHVRPLIAHELAEVAKIRITLTNQQAQLLRVLRRRKMAAICGGAGTGKTLLAMEKARNLALDGVRTLLLCYNRPLAEHFRRIVGETSNLLTMNFHQFCEWRLTDFQDQTGRDLLKEAEADYPSQDRFGVHYPFALTIAQEEMPELFDAIIIDEGQDFENEYWMPINVSLRSEKDSILYVFFDDNQRLYTQVPSFAIREEDTYFLTKNCRNTRHIHELAYTYFGGGKIAPPENEGVPIQQILAHSLTSQAKKIQSLVTDLISKEKVHPEDIVVLIAGAPKSEYYSKLESAPLPQPAQWIKESHSVENTVLIDTVRRFKGLESPIVVLWGIDDIDPMESPEIPYVGSSRAKSHLYLVGKPDCCNRLINPHISV